MSQSAIVIGGGIAGCSTAYSLAQRGIAVTLLERNTTIASSASGNPVAMLYPKFSAQASLANNLTNLGFHFTTALIKKFAHNSQFYNACGQLQLAFNTAEQAKQDELYKSDYLQKNQWFMQFLDAQEASEIAGINLTMGGLLLPSAGWVKPVSFCQALCESNLINVLINCQALTIKSTQNGWRVTHNNGFLDAENVVICNANDVKTFGFCDSAQITPVRDQLDFFAANIASQHLKTIICSDHYLSPAIDCVHAIGTTYAPNNLNAEISAADTQSNLYALKKISPEIFQKIDPKTISSRVAFRSQTLDYRPLAGQVLDEEKLQKNPPRYNANPADLPWLRGLYVNAGHGSKGMITAPICGELIANLITKTDLSIDARLASSMSPSRFLLRELGAKQLAASLYN
jgi:tRNA 5-methylaminomethyl-2-thiouridine biosynthesis bifunctional protein